MARSSYSPRLAPFPLRVLPGDSEHPEPLVELVRLRLLYRRPKPFFLHGPSSRALETALRHLAQSFLDEERLVLVRDASLEARLDPRNLLCSITEDPWSIPPEWRAVLLPVQESAIHDYLLEKHPASAEKCLERLARRPLPREVLEDHERCATALEQLANDKQVAHRLSDVRLKAHLFLARLHSSMGLSEKPSWTPTFCAELRDLLAEDPMRRQILAEKLRDASGSEDIVLCACCIGEPGFRPPVELQITLEDLHLVDIDLSGWELGSNVLRCDLSRAQLRDLRARNLLLIQTRLSHADLRQADLEGAVIDLCNLAAADLRSSRLVEIRSSQTIWCEARLEHAEVRDATLLEARFDGAHLDGAALEGTLFCDSALVCASLDRARAAGVSFTRCELRGTLARGVLARRAAFQDCDLAGSDWSGADLRGASFVRVRCRDQQLGPADFRGARLDQPTAEELRRLGAWV